MSRTKNPEWPEQGKLLVLLQPSNDVMGRILGVITGLEELHFVPIGDILLDDTNWLAYGLDRVKSDIYLKILRVDVANTVLPHYAMPMCMSVDGDEGFAMSRISNFINNTWIRRHQMGADEVLQIGGEMVPVWQHIFAIPVGSGEGTRSMFVTFPVETALTNEVRMDLGLFVRSLFDFRDKAWEGSVRSVLGKAGNMIKQRF